MNNMTEIVARGVLIAGKWFGLENLQVYGDAKGIIDQVKGLNNFNPLILNNWMKHIKTIVSSYQLINIDHIYGEQNWTAD